ncbi:MAG TPA: glycoside hydrolase family 130 protein [Gemmatimonadaceae bacterium]|nr:glycoside hydrolase family 130 protein [Gemmatimonadaceae bacterium]
MVQPSRPDLEVVGAFNAAAIRHDGEVLLLLRVAEAPRVPEAIVAAPFYNPASGELEIKQWNRDAAGVNTTDPRVTVVDGKTWLTSISHLRIARSTDGINFEIDPKPSLSAADEYESFGTEDPRITLIDGTYWINYTAVSPFGISTALASTKDFRSFERHGIIFSPPNRDVTIFPEKIGGRYAALHRPMASEPGENAIWSATSPDLFDWGHHRYVAGARPGAWDDLKIGGGAVPFRVRTKEHDGWLAVYHGVTASPMTYSLGALLLDAENPSEVIGRSASPILAPEAEYERSGFFDGVVFTCGLLAEDDLVRIYYGAADGVTAVADLSLDDILAGLD